MTTARKDEVDPAVLGRHARPEGLRAFEALAKWSEEAERVLEKVEA